MAQIKVIGRTQEALIIDNGDDTYAYTCSKGMWCDLEDEIRPEDTMADIIAAAEVHIDRHDG